MSLRCYFGNCTRTTDHLTIGIPSEVGSFENRILGGKFRSDLQTWINQTNYHAYLTVNSLGANLTPAVVWDEYLRHPAPTYAGRRSAPVETGDTSFAVAPPVLPLGLVEHIVDNHNRILANVTLRTHLLYPGYVVRWIRLIGNRFTSYTLGRGLGILPQRNENGGAQAFTDLDGRIARRLAVTTSR